MIIGNQDTGFLPSSASSLPGPMTGDSGPQAPVGESPFPSAPAANSSLSRSHPPSALRASEPRRGQGRCDPALSWGGVAEESGESKQSPRLLLAGLQVTVCTTVQNRVPQVKIAVVCKEKPHLNPQILRWSARSFTCIFRSKDSLTKETPCSVQLSCSVMANSL